MLVICETHPVPYHAPVYKVLAQTLGVPVHVLYGSNFSVQGYFDQEFRTSVTWSREILDGYSHSFINTVENGGARDYDSVPGTGVCNAIRQLSPTAILALGYHHPLDRSAIYTALTDRVPLLFRGETTDVALARPFMRRVMRDAVLRRLYQRCASLLYVGKNSRAHYERLGVPASKLIRSPYCVDTASFASSADYRTKYRAAMRKQLGIAENAIGILFSGKLSIRKGVDMLPAAVRSLPEPLRKRAHLLFMGDGVLKSALIDACAIKPDVAATFVGFQNQADLSPYFHAADILALPSRTMETWGLVVNEALEHGLPCVVSDCVGAQPDLVVPGKTGEVFKNGDIGSLSIALAKVMVCTGQPEIADACRAQMQGYSANAAAQGIHKAWRAIERSSA